MKAFNDTTGNSQTNGAVAASPPTSKYQPASCRPLPKLADSPQHGVVYDGQILSLAVPVDAYTNVQARGSVDVAAVHVVVHIDSASAVIANRDTKTSWFEDIRCWTGKDALHFNVDCHIIKEAPTAVVVPAVHQLMEGTCGDTSEVDLTYSVVDSVSISDFPLSRTHLACVGIKDSIEKVFPAGVVLGRVSQTSCS